MAQSKKPRKSYQRPNFRAEAVGLNPEKYGEQARAEQAGESQSAEQAHPESVPIDKEPVAPAHPHVTHRALRGRGRYLVPVAAGAGVVGGGAFLAHRARRRKAEMAKGLIDPTTGESVSFGKRYIDDEVDEKPHGALVAKAGIPKRAALLMRAGQGATVAGRGARAGAKNVRGAARGARDFTREASDTMAEGTFARAKHASAPGKLGGAKRAGRLVGANAPGLGMAGAGYAVGRLDENGNKRYSEAERKARRVKASKRYDMTALEHTGSRRVGGRLPVSTVRTAGLPVQSATFSRGNPEARPGTRSHANKLTHVHTNVKAARTGKLYQLHRRSRSKSGTSIGKSAGYAQSAGNGRRLVNV